MQTTSAVHRSNVKTIAGIAFVVLVWGSVWPVYKVALLYCPPLLFSGLRSLIGGVLFTIYLLPRITELNLNEAWPQYAVATLFNVILFFGVQSIGLQYLPAGLFAVIVYLQPVLVVLLAWLWLNESLTTRKLVGILLGFLGVVFVSWEGITGKISMPGIILAIVAAAAWALGTVYAKKIRQLVHALWLVAVQNVAGGVVLTIAAIAIEPTDRLTWNFPLIFALVFGGMFGVILAFVVYYRLINSGDAAKVSSFTFLVPLLSVVLSTIFLDEPVTTSLLLGIVLILSSIILINITRSAAKRAKPIHAARNLFAGEENGS